VIASRGHRAAWQDVALTTPAVDGQGTTYFVWALISRTTELTWSDPLLKRPHRARKSFTRFRAWAGTGRAANVTAIRQRSHDWSPTAWATRRSERGCSYPTAPSRTMSAASWT